MGSNLMLLIFLSCILLTVAKVAILDAENIKEIVTDDLNPRLKNYYNLRRQIFREEIMRSTSGKIRLVAKEIIVNNIFMKYKTEELEEAFQQPEKNAPGMHFFRAKSLIENSRVFKCIRKMPKGAVLHLHTSAAVSLEFLLKNITHTPNIMRCVNINNTNIFVFNTKFESDTCRAYYNIYDERKHYNFSEEYEKFLEFTLSLFTPNPEAEYSNINIVWKRFQNIFKTVKHIVRYHPIFKIYYRQLLEELYEDNIMYAELRINLMGLYNDTYVFSKEEYLREVLKIVKEFKKTHENFLGVKLIYATSRNIKPDELKILLKDIKELQAKYKNVLIGFDLVGQEDTGNSLKQNVEILNDPEYQTRYFFHAGETNWYGADTDINLVDSVLLNATRIGHGYALLKHPEVRERLKQKDIALEICPLSNQVLKLVSDLRNHPASYYMAEDIPMVISNDDPGFWSARGLSYDYYYAIMSFAPNHAGVETLKKLVLNSLKYSVLNSCERKKAQKIFNRQWEQFLDFIIENDKN